MSTFKLIDGRFTVAEAREVVLALLEYKINFHSRENFGSEIREGRSNERSLMRRDELLRTRVSFLEAVSGMDPDATVAVTADIILS